MAYELGSYIDLTFLNPKPRKVDVLVHHLYDVGESISFVKFAGQYNRPLPVRV